MKIEDIRILRGPNFWSGYRQKLVVMKLDLEHYEELPTNKINGFYERIIELLPSLHEHYCSEEEPGGLCTRMKEGTWLGHVIEHVALELQVLAGIDVGFGRTRSTGTKGVYHVVFSYESEEAGRHAGCAAVELVRAVAESRPYSVKEVVEELADIWRSERPGPSTQAIIDEAERRRIPVTRLDDHSLYLLGQGAKQQLFRATIMGTTSNVGVDTAGCKWTTKKLLYDNGIPVSRGIIIEDRSELPAAVKSIGFPLVIKPVDGNHGRGITAEINDMRTARKAWKLASGVGNKIIVEQHLKGYDFRLLVINYQLVAVARRTPPAIIGDGISTVRQLVDALNADPKRGRGHECTLTRVSIDQHTRMLLKERGMTPDTVLPKGQWFQLKRTANLSTGGTSEDVTDLVHPETKFMAERVARLVKLDVCGIDLMAQDISIPLNDQHGGIIEVNAAPGLRMHTNPSSGTPRQVAKPLLDMLFPNDSNGRIPLVAITGTNGKTTTTRLMAHIAAQAGRSVGYTTTEGVYINGHLVRKGDCTGPASTRMVLCDPMVDFAVLECARGGILRAGLGFDKCDVSIVTNVTEDHLGIDDIHDLDDYTRVKEVVPRSTASTGYAVLNADDDRVYGMRKVVRGQVILTSTGKQTDRIEAHCERGGTAVVLNNGLCVLRKGQHEIPIMPVADIPLTFGGKAEFMIQNVLFSIAGAIASDFDLAVIRTALKSFVPSPELTPGRMNLFRFGHFDVMLDYAHNPDGFNEIEKYMASVDAARKVCIIGATGDRRDDDIRQLGKYAARIFDEIIIRHDKDTRGRPTSESTALILEGVKSVDPMKKVVEIPDEQEAIEYAVRRAQTDWFIFVCADGVLNSIQLIRDAQQRMATSTLQAS